jgi:hypothetical protein
MYALYVALHTTNPQSQSAERYLLLSDVCWVALALLHRENRDQPSFTARQIIDRIRKEQILSFAKSSVQAHIYQHCVANVEPSTGTYRMLTRLPNSTFRLFRPGDYSHPERKGKTRPNRADLPKKYHFLLDWYESTWIKIRQKQNDPVLELLGAGKEIWRSVDSDGYVKELREGWEEKS